MRYLYFFLFCLGVCSLTNGQECPVIYSGAKTLYKEGQANIQPDAAGYEPVFINYAGRHGARHLTKDVSTLFIYTALQKADHLELLSETGKRLQAMVLLLEKVEKTNNKSISSRGMIELNGIATRMYAHYPGLFASGISDIMITKEKRTLQSAEAFITGLSLNTEQRNQVHKYVNDTILRFFDLSPSYLRFEEKGNWQKSLDKLKQQLQYDLRVQKIADRFFKPGYTLFENAEEKHQFVSDLFGFAVIIPSIEKEIREEGFSAKDLDFTSFFDCEELTLLGKVDNAEDFLLKGPGNDNKGIQVRIAAPLLMDFIKTTDEFIKTGKEPVHLRFTHAEAIAPLAALMSINGASEPVKNMTDFEKHWKTEEVIPLSANIQWIVYRKNNDYFVKILLNEKPATINGLTKKNYPFYKWKELQTFYLKKLHTIGLERGNNYYRFLQTLP